MKERVTQDNGTAIEVRPRVFHTIAQDTRKAFSLADLFEPHDQINEEEVELHLGIVE